MLQQCCFAISMHLQMKILFYSLPLNKKIITQFKQWTFTFISNVYVQRPPCITTAFSFRAEKEDKEEEMIKSRMEAIFIISMHTMQNIIGVIRFSYGFHRTGSPNVGLKLDVCLGTESFANILTDAIVIFLLWKEEKSLGVDVRLAQMTRVLGVFIAWNAIALHVCAFGNLMGLLYPPKWYTNEDADALSVREKASGSQNVHKRFLERCLSIPPCNELNFSLLTGDDSGFVGTTHHLPCILEAVLHQFAVRVLLVLQGHKGQAIRFRRSFSHRG
ncbi:uncharacterized protein LOC119159976 isoform X2 [Rhipicephalus microplus]|uniref:uncharacterized protein LOC119159976 isoform X2 n=1 Tax=Rhipicephalus microplus TaxID=6941 RepID=UPI003F6C3FF6